MVIYLDIVYIRGINTSITIMYDIIECLLYALVSNY